MVVDLLHDGGEAVVLAANLMDAKVADRVSGLESIIRHSPSQQEAAGGHSAVVQCLADGGDPDRLVRNIQQALAEHPRLECLIDVSGRGSRPVLAALSKAARLGDVKVITFGHSHDTLEAIERGQVFAAISPDPYEFGYASVTRALALTEYTALELPMPGRGVINIPCCVIDANNVRRFLSEQDVSTAAKQGG